MIGGTMRDHRRLVGSLLATIALVALLVALPAAQYGHPLKGTWSGEWGPTAETRHRLLLDLHWDGKVITGTINPGRDAVPIRTASLEPSTWTVRFEAEGSTPSGASIRYLVEGKLDNLGSAHRVLTGTWTEGGERGDFRLTRN
jgi:hypothetical protein